MKWIKDEEFIRGDIPMTKFNIRILTIGYLEIKEGDRFLDIGAGTGSVSIEAALQGAKVWAIEREEEGIALIRENNKRFNTDINIIKGQAPDALPDIKFNKCFIGGSRGRLEDIFSYLDKNLDGSGIVCGNFITLDNLNQCINLLKEHRYNELDIQLIQGAYMDKIGLMKGQNPIYIVKGVKSDD